jgi:uncharacterized damage-inducible protein DinB
MDIKGLQEQMELDARRIQAMLEGISDEQARWKPDAGTWSMLEVLGHLLDEERRDFRVRLDLLLRDPAAEWPHIDPMGWVTEHRYNEQDPAATLQGFLDERRASLAWLHSLQSPDWESSALAPWGGRIRAGDMLAAWVAHDTLHMRQLVELQHAWVVHLSTPYETGYAGDW